MIKWHASINVFALDEECSYSVRMWTGEQRGRGFLRPQRQYTGRIHMPVRQDPKGALREILRGILEDL